MKEAAQNLINPNELTHFAQLINQKYNDKIIHLNVDQI